MGDAYRLQILPAARRQLEHLPRQPQLRVREAIRGLAANPHPHGAKLLSGDHSMWRIRVGDYRVLYQIRGDTLVVLIVRIGHRRDVYRSR